MATTATPPTKPAKTPPPGSARPIRKLVPNGPPLLRFYRSSVGKKWVMAVTGVVLMGFVVFHLVGNLKLYLSKEEINLYGEALRDMPGHLLPRTVLLWTLRSGLFVAFVLHLHSAYGLTITNRKARPERYQSKRDYVAADFASRTMRWTGIIVLLYVFVSMYSATMERRREIATMRALGARRATVLGIVLAESAALATVGGIGGIIGGHAVAYLAGSRLGSNGLVTNPFLVDVFEPAVLAGIILLGTLAGLLPAVLAYRTEVAENLAPLS